MRSNPGGDNGTYRPLQVLNGLAADQPGSVVVLVGRSTFSAAGNFVAELRRSADVVLVGEPMGAAPNHFGDAEVRMLPASGMRVHIATRDWTFPPGNNELIIVPDVSVPVRWSDYSTGINATLDAALDAD